MALLHRNIHVKRLRIVNGDSLCISHTYFIKKDNEWILDEIQDNTSGYDFLENKHHKYLSHEKQYFSVDI